MSDLTKLAEPVAWLLTDEKINDLQVSTVSTLVQRAKAAHFCNVYLRINGRDEIYEADWLKHLTQTNLDDELAEVKKERDALAAAMPSEGADAALAYAAEHTRAEKAEAALVGWSFEPSTKHGIQYMIIKAPNGYSAHIASHAMNPANILYMLAEAIRGAKE